MIELHANGVVNRAVAIVDAVDNGGSVNEVEAAGNTPLHHAAYEGWLQGAELLLSLGAHINASNNAGDRPWHWARNMGHADMMEMLEQVWYIPWQHMVEFTPEATSVSVLQNGAVTEQGKVLVADHIPKVKVWSYQLTY